MTGNREIADQALRDLAELDAQVADGEIDEDRARELRDRYRATAAAALAAPDEPAAAPAPVRRRATRAWTLAYTLAGAVALVAAVVVLPGAVVDRPSGGAVTGIEPMAGGPPAGGDGAPAIDPAAVDNQQLEAVVAANPQVLGMRLALADRYVAEGDYGAAMRHYVRAVDQSPDDVGARTRMAWLLLQIGQDGPALENADRAVALQPGSIEAAWVRANVLVDGTGDPAAGVAVLERLAARGDLTSEVRSRVDELLARARGQVPGGGR